MSIANGDQPPVQVLDISNADYHGRSECSSSRIKLLPGNPMLYKGRYIDDPPTMPFKRTDAVILGTKVHRALLDGTEVRDVPDSALTKSRAKSGDAWKDYDAKYGDKYVLVVPGNKKDDGIRPMLANLRAHKTVQELLEASVFREQSIIWTDPTTGLGCRARLDDVARRKNRNILWDLKTASDISERACDNQAATLGYHRSLEWYATGLAQVGDRLTFGSNIDTYLIVWVQSSAPYHIAVDEIDKDTIDTAAQENAVAREDLLHRLGLHCAGDDSAWLPDNYHLIRRKLKLPKWYEKEV